MVCAPVGSEGARAAGALGCCSLMHCLTSSVFRRSAHSRRRHHDDHPAAKNGGDLGYRRGVRPHIPWGVPEELVARSQEVGAGKEGVRRARVRM